MVCSNKTSFIFLFDKQAQNDPVWGRSLKRLLFSFFWKRDRVPCLVWSRVLCACRFVFRSGSVDIALGDASLFTRDDTSNRYSSGSIWHFGVHPNIREILNVPWSVLQDVSGRVIVYIKFVVCWCATFPLLPHNCLWLPLKVSSREGGAI